MQIPTVPAFVTGDTSVAKLRQLSQCVSFVSNAQNYPVWHVYRNSLYGLTTANTWYTLAWPYVAFDSDRVAVYGGALIVTQGYYCCEACIPFQSQSSANNAQGQFLFTAGPSNPHYTSGTTIAFGYRFARIIGTAGTDEVMCLDDLCPAVCYPGDTLAVQAQGALANTNVDYNNPTGATAGRFVPNFTGRWVRIGS